MCIAPCFHLTIYSIAIKAFFFFFPLFWAATLAFYSCEYRISWSWRKTILGLAKELGIDQSGINRLVNFKWLSFKQHLDYPMQMHLML